MGYVNSDSDACRNWGKRMTLEEAQDKLREREEQLARKDEELRRRGSEVALVTRVSQAFSSLIDLDRILITALEEVRRLLEVDACSIWLRDAKTDELVCEYAIGTHSQTVRGWRLAPGQGIAGMVAQSGQAVIVPDVFADPRHFTGVDQRTGQTLRSILTVPLKANQEVIGVLQVLDLQEHRFAENDRAALELLAAIVSMAIDNARLKERLWQATETKTLLAEEVSQRGKYHLALIADLLFWAQRTSATQPPNLILAHLLNQAHLLMTVNSYLAENEWNPFSLHDLTSRVIHAALKLIAPGIEIYVAVAPSPIRLAPQYASSLALILHELVLHTAQHGLANHSSGHIAAQMSVMNQTLHFEYRDDGDGYPDAILDMSHPTPGFLLIQKLARDELRGELSLYNHQGAVAMIRSQAVLQEKPK